MADMKLHYVIAELHVVTVIFSIFYCCYALIVCQILITCTRQVLLHVDAGDVYRLAPVITFVSY